MYAVDTVVLPHSLEKLSNPLDPELFDFGYSPEMEGKTLSGAGSKRRYILYSIGCWFGLWSRTPNLIE